MRIQRQSAFSSVRVREKKPAMVILIKYSLRTTSWLSSQSNNACQYEGALEKSLNTLHKRAWHCPYVPSSLPLLAQLLLLIKSSLLFIHLKTLLWSLQQYLMLSVISTVSAGFSNCSSCQLNFFYWITQSWQITDLHCEHLLFFYISCFNSHCSYLITVYYL